MESIKKQRVKGLLTCKDNPLRKPMVLRVPRQVGKSTIVKEFA